MNNSDCRQRFLFNNTDIRGEITSLTSSYQTITADQYPEPICLLLGEFLAAASLLSATLKFPATITLQATGSGPLSAVMAECSQGSKLRGIVRGELNDINKTHSLQDFLGTATLAITVEPQGGERYQGIVPMEANDLSGCLEHYFSQSEQLATKIKLSANRHGVSGLMIQQMPSSGDDEKHRADWQHLSTLMNTLSDEEQLNLSHNDQLYRLFHEENIRLFEAQPLHFFCSCSRQRTEQALISLGHAELRDIYQKQGLIQINCEFCGQQYDFTADQIEQLLAREKTPIH